MQMVFLYFNDLFFITLSSSSISLAIIFHTNFADQMQFMSFLKNIAIAGGFLIIFVNGPTKFSLDHKLKVKKRSKV